MSMSDQEICENLLAKAIFTGGVPFRFVENEYFLKFLAHLRPTFNPPSRTTLSEVLLDKIYNEVETEVKKKIDDAQSLTIQCDSYSNVNSEGVMNFIINTPHPVYYKSLERKDDSQTGEYLAEQVSKVIQEVGPKKTVALMTDNAAYCKKAWRLIEAEYAEDQIRGYGCAAHILNLVCLDIVNQKSAHSIVDEAVRIVKTVKQTHILTSALKDVQKSSNEQDKVLTTLKLPGKTSWGSYLACLTSIYENSYNLKTLAISKHSDRLSHDVKQTILDDTFWWKVLQLSDLLRPVVIWLKKIEGNESLICSMVDIFTNLEENIRNKLLNSAPSIFSVSETENLLNKLVQRATSSLTPIHFAANILDPSKRGKKLNENDYSAGYDTILKLNKKFDNIPEEILLVELAQYTAQNKFWSAESVKKSAVLVNAVDWWAGVCGCTALSKVAIPILNLPCSSAATERSFSTYGWIHNAKLNRLSVHRASKVAYIAQNLKLLDPQQYRSKCEDYDSEHEDIEDTENLQDNTEENNSHVTGSINQETNLLTLSNLPSNLELGTYFLQEDSSLVLENTQ